MINCKLLNFVLITFNLFDQLDPFQFWPNVRIKEHLNKVNHFQVKAILVPTKMRSTWSTSMYYIKGEERTFFSSGSFSKQKLRNLKSRIPNPRQLERTCLCFATTKRWPIKWTKQRNKVTCTQNCRTHDRNLNNNRGTTLATKLIFQECV